MRGSSKRNGGGRRGDRKKLNNLSAPRFIWCYPSFGKPLGSVVYGEKIDFVTGGENEKGIIDRGPGED